MYRLFWANACFIVWEYPRLSIYYWYCTLFPRGMTCGIPITTISCLVAWLSLLVLLLSGLFHALHIDHQRVWIQLLIITLLGAICSRAAICITGVQTATVSYRCCQFENSYILYERSNLREISSDLYDVFIGGNTVTWWKPLHKYSMLPTNRKCT